jgi:hypothetical protein
MDWLPDPIDALPADETQSDLREASQRDVGNLHEMRASSCWPLYADSRFVTSFARVTLFSF